MIKISNSFEKIVSSLLLILFMTVYFFISYPSFFSDNSVDIIDGTVDLCSKQIDKSINILGDWEKLKNYSLSRNGAALSHVKENLDVLSDVSYYNYDAYKVTILGCKNKDAALNIENIQEPVNIFVDGVLKYNYLPSKLLTSSSNQLKVSNMIILPQADEVKIIICVKKGSSASFINKDPIKIGTVKEIYSNVIFSDFFGLAAFGATVVFGLYFLISFFTRRKDYNLIFLALFNLFMGVRILFTDSILITKIFQSLSIAEIIKIDYSLYIISMVFFIYFLHNTFKKESYKPASYIFIVISIMVWLGIMNVFENGTILLRVIGMVYITMFIAYSFKIAILAATREREGSKIIVDALLVLTTGIVNDMLVRMEIIEVHEILPISLIFLMLFQSIYFSIKHIGQIEKSDKMMVTLNKINHKNIKFNEAASKFVPIEFLHYLKKETITDIKLGDYQEFYMTVLFIDIRDFTNMSEALTPQENFAFLNSYLKVISPSISKYGGFIDKYIGDAVMALFPKKPSDAVDATLAIKEQLLEYNIGRAKAGYEPIKIGAGIHTGKLILGTIGSEYRMETTVISDAVNVSSRLEHATKNYGESILISDEIYKTLNDEEKYVTREVDYVKLRGKRNKTIIYSILNEDDRYNKEYLDEYTIALDTFKNNDFTKALEMFNKLIDKSPFDKVAHIYRDRCRYADISGAPEDWGGFYDII